MPSCAPTSKSGFPLTSKPGKLLSFYSGPNSSEEFRKRYFERVGELDQIFQRRISQRPLNARQVGPVHVGLFGELLLRPLPVVPEPAQPFGKGSFRVFGGNQTPMLWLCRL